MIGARDAAAIALMYGAGLRRHEVCKVNIGHYTLETGNLRVWGKGGTYRMCYVTNGARRAIEDWLHYRGAGDMDDLKDPLITKVADPAAPAAEGEGLRLSGQTVYVIVGRRARMAGLKIDANPHDLRRTFCTNLLSKGVDLNTVRKLMGHSQISTTARYDKRGEDAKIRAMKLLDCPYREGV